MDGEEGFASSRGQAKARRAAGRHRAEAHGRRAVGGAAGKGLMTEDQLEQEALGWLGEVGYSHLHRPDIGFDGTAPERSDYWEVSVAPQAQFDFAFDILPFARS